jgi:hypothetical protein
MGVTKYRKNASNLCGGFYESLTKTADIMKCVKRYFHVS